jgi:hypothetical protein
MKAMSSGFSKPSISNHIQISFKSTSEYGCYLIIENDGSPYAKWKATINSKPPIILGQKCPTENLNIRRPK